MKFGVGPGNALRGADLAVRVQQVAALLPAAVIFLASAYRPILLKGGLFPFLFGLGASALPRWELLGLSLLYRLSGSEVAVALALPLLALALGLAAGPLLRSRKRSVPARWVLAGLIVLDLLSRLLPFRFNLSFGWPLAILGFLLRLASLALILLDLRTQGRRGARREKAGAD